MTSPVKCAVLVLSLLVGFPAIVAATVIGVEDPINGFVGPMEGPGPYPFVTNITVASAGQGPFRPFGLPFDVADAIEFGPCGFVGCGWQPAANTTDSWHQYPGTNVWYTLAPALGTWVEPGAAWTSGAIGILQYSPFFIIEAGTSNTSDAISIFNDAAGTSAYLVFIPVEQSGSTPPPQVREPDGLTLLGLAGGLLAYAWRWRRAVVR